MKDLSTHTSIKMSEGLGKVHRVGCSSSDLSLPVLLLFSNFTPPHYFTLVRFLVHIFLHQTASVFTAVAVFSRLLVPCTLQAIFVVASGFSRCMFRCYLASTGLCTCRGGCTCVSVTCNVGLQKDLGELSCGITCQSVLFQHL